jgi:PTS system nitrogen regulatory IIA component
MNIRHCFGHGTAVADLHSTDKYDALRELIHGAPVFQEIDGLDEFAAAVVDREKIQTAGLGHGVAVAHGRVQGVRRVLIALGVSRRGIRYESPDGEPVRLLFVIASPPHVTLDYLQALSTLVRGLRRQPVRDSLLAAADAEEIEARIRSAYCAELERLTEPAAGRKICGAAPIRRSASAG